MLVAHRYGFFKNVQKKKGKGVMEYTLLWGEKEIFARIYEFYVDILKEYSILTQ